MRKKEKVLLPDRNQNYWQMASIQSAAFGIVVLNFGAELGAKMSQYGTAWAIIAICVGNLLLWLVGLAIIAMTIKDRKNAIENLIEYIGRYGCWLGGIVLSLAVLSWYPIQIRETVSEMKTILEPYLPLTSTFSIRLGTVFGILTSLLVIGGIKLIKWFNVISLPFLMIFICYAIIKNPSLPSAVEFCDLSKISTKEFLESMLLSILSTASTSLAGVVNVPTFFRHRRREVDAYFAFSIFVFFTALVECMAIFLINSKNGESFTKYLSHTPFDMSMSILFLIIAMFSINLVNIYYASAALEVPFPWISRSKELALIGMGGTLVFALFQAQEILRYLSGLFTNYIGILGVILIMGYAVKRIVEHRERKFELLINTVCWLVGCIVSAFILDIQLQKSALAFSAGIVVSFLLVVAILFIEESVWSFKEAVFKNK